MQNQDDKTHIGFKRNLDIFYVAHDPTQTTDKVMILEDTQIHNFIWLKRRRNLHKYFIDDKQKSFENKIVTEVKRLDKFSLLKDIIKIILN